MSTHYQRPALPHGAAVRRGTSHSYPANTYEIDVPMLDDEAAHERDLLASADAAMKNGRAPSNSYTQRAFDVIRAAVQDYSLPAGQVATLVLSSTRGSAIVSLNVSLPRRVFHVQPTPFVREFDCTLAEYRAKRGLK